MRRTRESGVTLIDTVVAVGLLAMVFVGITAAFRLSVDVVTNNKARAGAIALADERMEYIRSLSYSAIGTVGGVPAGTIAQSEQVSLNGVAYTRRTTIEYVDDPGDGTGAADGNHIPEDYKSARVDVSWGSHEGVRHIVLVTRIEPPGGMEIACVSCGTLSIAVQDANHRPVSSAQVQIVNASTTPAVNITTFTDVNGLVSIVGTPAAPSYQVIVSKPGYSTDQTYASTPQNPNPSPGPLTVSNGQTTSSTFSIDVLATKNVYTWTQILSGTWNDPLDDSSKIATSTNIAVAGGGILLAGSPGSYPSYGEFQSIAIGPSALARWKTLSWVGATSSATTMRIHLYDGAGATLIPDVQLSGNSAGLTAQSIDLSGVSTTTYPAIRADFTLRSNDPSATPSIGSYAIAYEYGPLSLPSIAFTMVGAKKIGNGPPLVYKYNQTLSTSAFGGITIPSIEWDTYTISVAQATGYDIASSCNPQPEALAPGSTASTNLYLAAHTTNSLLIDVSSGGVLIPNAAVSIWKSGTATTTLQSDQCGQAFFGGLSAATYWVQVIATGHQSYIGTSPVSGTGRLSVVLN